MSGHTPWTITRVDTSLNLGARQLRLCDADGLILAYFAFHQDHEVRLAKARALMQAAPDLLEACKAFQDKTLLMDLWSNDDLKPILRRMKAAIAKAEGETT